MAWVAARIPSTHGALASLGRKPPANLERILCGERNELPRDELGRRSTLKSLAPRFCRAGTPF
jgi:hypothetical protein